MTSYHIAVLPGDGIGPEVTGEAVRVLETVGKQAGVSFEFEHALIGGAAIDATGGPLPPETLALCRASEAILFGAVGGPKWDHLPHERRRSVAALDRKDLDLYANLRPPSAFRCSSTPRPSSAPSSRAGHHGDPRAEGGLYYGGTAGVERFAEAAPAG